MTAYSVLLFSYFFSEFDVISLDFFQFIFHIISLSLNTNLETFIPEETI